MVEFTGERVVPGQVNPDLWSEHLARYAFSRRFAAGKRVLDAGCGTGYGSAELADSASFVVGLDLAPDAVSYGRETYPLHNLRFAAGSCTALPFTTGAFDVVVAYEVIEHLDAYADLIREAARVLSPEGIFIVSTPNKLYYAESRAETGPNPYHTHEFEAVEFAAQLGVVFGHVCLLVQNRVESFAFHPTKTYWPADARIDGGGGSPADAHFFIAVCSQSSLPEMRSFSYVPRAANILREREQHVKLLETELEQTRRWLDQMQHDRDELLGLFRQQKEEMEKNNRWAAQLNAELGAAHQRIVDLQQEVVHEQTAAADVAHGYEKQVQHLEQENRLKTEWARETEERLSSELAQRTAELVECVRLLEQAESTVEERTAWAQRAEAEHQRIAAELNAARASRWLKLGRRLGLGPAFQEP